MTEKPRPTAIKSIPSGRSPSSSPPSPSKSLTLTQQFADIIRRYKYYCQHIQRILKETDKSYNNINDTRVLTPGIKDFFLKKIFIYLFIYLRKNNSNANIKIGS